MDYLKDFSKIFTSQVLTGAALGALIIPFILFGVRRFLQHLVDSRPARKVVERLASNSENCPIFIDRLRSSTGELSRRLPKDYPVYYPNGKNEHRFVRTAYELWSEGDAGAAVYILNIIGKLGKTQKLDIIPVGKAWDKWDTNIVCIGGNLKTHQPMS